MSLVEFNSIIYRNIGHKFHSIDTTLNLCPEPLSFNELYSHLAAHEILFNSVPLIILLIMLYTIPTKLALLLPSPPHNPPSISPS